MKNSTQISILLFALLSPIGALSASAQSVAVATGDSLVLFKGFGQTRSMAEENALANCSNSIGGCHILRAVDNGCIAVSTLQSSIFDNSAGGGEILGIHTGVGEDPDSAQQNVSCGVHLFSSCVPWLVVCSDEDPNN